MESPVQQGEVRQVSAAPSELHEAWDAIQHYALPVLVAVGVAIALALGIVLFRNRAESGQQDAMALLTSARSFDDLDRVVSDYESSSAAPLALLKLGQAHYASGNYTMATEKYDAFIARHATHPLATAAEIGKLQCLEAQGRLQEALAGYQSFASSHAGHFLYGEAIFGQGRCLEQLGRFTDARVLYEQFITANPESAWLERAEDVLAQVNAIIARGGPVVPLALPAAAPAMTPFSLPTAPMAEAPAAAAP
jgi:tetratricopeptide (TPR) repeat protein